MLGLTRDHGTREVSGDPNTMSHDCLALNKPIGLQAVCLCVCTCLTGTLVKINVKSHSLRLCAEIFTGWLILRLKPGVNELRTPVLSPRSLYGKSSRAGGVACGFCTPHTREDIQQLRCGADTDRNRGELGGSRSGWKALSPQLTGAPGSNPQRPN
ncbi:hypothetical protein RRG08_022881 [Elysia crispata]|uniref:Uncharacterized protein n=1 Tax=Elysia crispata TaxID=231223 RepID=A0AAE0Z0I3_9GAST|nr:hypothetical protein RRG08_022881 [Elysia crispata]